ncbi:MAG: hypothetical protein K2P38_02610 [Lachnospiraceae bacterium]|nr:hypothetical protein [Lachnospiraceae bacterium]
MGGIVEAALHPADSQRDLPHCRLNMAGIAPCPTRQPQRPQEHLSWQFRMESMAAS